MSLNKTLGSNYKEKNEKYSWNHEKDLKLRKKKFIQNTNQSEKICHENKKKVYLLIKQ